MNALGWTLGASVASALVAAAFVGARTEVAILLGLLGPLLAAGGTWVLVERVFRRRPDRVTPLMIAAFGAKLVSFGAYVAVVLRVLAVAPVPFVVSFTSYFVGLYAAEAVSLHRLFSGGRGVR
jgi:hypothetical protein